MDTIWVGHLIGTFHGYSPGRTYELSDGTKWHQQDLTDEPVYGEDPNAKLLSDPDTGIVYLDVRETSAIVRVFRAGGNRTVRISEDRRALFPRRSLPWKRRPRSRARISSTG